MPTDSDSTQNESDEFAHECEETVIRKIRERRDIGREKYGTTMERQDLSHLDWLKHAQEEAMDFAIYLERLIREEEQRTINPAGQN